MASFLEFHCFYPLPLLLRNSHNDTNSQVEKCVEEIQKNHFITFLYSENASNQCNVTRPTSFIRMQEVPWSIFCYWKWGYWSRLTVTSQKQARKCWQHQNHPAIYLKVNFETNKLVHTINYLPPDISFGLGRKICTNHT